MAEDAKNRWIKILPFFFWLLFLMPEETSAHAPKKIEVRVLGSTLKVKVYHHVLNLRQHYIKYIYVYVNGRWRVKQRFFYQKNEEYQEGVYILPSLRSRDTLMVIAYCNKHGKLEKTLIVP